MFLGFGDEWGDRVNDVFRRLLGRDATVEEAEPWAVLLSQGAASVADIEAAIKTTPEYAAVTGAAPTPGAPAAEVPPLAPVVAAEAAPALGLTPILALGAVGALAYFLFRKKGR